MLVAARSKECARTPASAASKMNSGPPRSDRGSPDTFLIVANTPIIGMMFGLPPIACPTTN